MRLTFVVDPLAGLEPAHDTTVALMEAAQRLGAEVWVTGVSDLVLEHDVAAAWSQPVRLAAALMSGGRWVTTDAWYETGPPQRLALADSDAVLMRVDPPVDAGYLRATMVLDAAVRAGALVVNDPAGLRNSNEKLLPLLVSDLAPPTLVSAGARDIRVALGRWGQAVAKPLEGMAGGGVVMLTAGDRGLESLLELVTDCGRRQVVVQQYLAAAADGDKRILLLDGEPIGAINRCARPGEFRCNMAKGALVSPATLAEPDLEICRRLRPVLRERGLLFAGIDVIGDRLTEVNVTSPTGIREVELAGSDGASDRVIEWIVAAAGARNRVQLGAVRGAR